MSEERYINREMSWLEFNQRVLDQGLDRSLPTLERLKFLAIVGSNLDEFFMVRVGGLEMLESGAVRKRDPAGMTPMEQLEAIARRVHAMAAQQVAGYRQEVEPRLAEHGIRRVRPSGLSEKARRHVEHVFEKELYPVISPVALRPGDELPLLTNRVLHVGVRLRSDQAEEGSMRLAAIPLGPAVNRFIALPADKGYHFILLEDVIRLFADRLFPGETVLECAPFRITRNADMSVREDLAADLLSLMEDVLDARKRSECVRLEVDSGVSRPVLGFLQQLLGIGERETYRLDGPLDMAAFMALATTQGFSELKYEPWPPQPFPDLDAGGSLFDVLAARDVLLFHPYDSFGPVLRLVEEAANDPNVLAIKQVLYRTSRDSPIIAALSRAAEQGKYVTVLVELKARFDEARNIVRAKALEDAGAQVVYGVKGLKTHAKVCIVVRREPQGLRRYVHFGTGNYNEVTAQLYSDVSYLTANDDLGADASAFFNTITGYSQPQKFRKLAAAPIGLRERLVELIDAEAERRREGQAALIMAKLNSLADPGIIDALYRASQAGVKVRLNVRGICCLRPGVPGLSENISVVSIVDRFLEHSRILYFRHGGEQRVFISSADWMPRNLDRRVELLVPVDDPASRARLIGILETCFRDTSNAWRMRPDGTYDRVRPSGRARKVTSQASFYKQACDAVRKIRRRRLTVFEPHRPPSAEA